MDPDNKLNFHRRCHECIRGSAEGGKSRQIGSKSGEKTSTTKKAGKKQILNAQPITDARVDDGAQLELCR